MIPTVWQYRRGTVKPADFERLIKLVYFADFERLGDYYPGMCMHQVLAIENVVRSSVERSAGEEWCVLCAQSNE
jgi:hypothetical protein